MDIVEEVKIHKNKQTQRFSCRLLLREQGHMILFYKSSAEGKIADIVIKKGSSTIAHYWTGRGYVLWRMYDAEINLIGTLFHICREVDMSDHGVSYIDLVLDIWIPPDGSARVLDEDELEECKCAGLLTQDETAWIEKQKKYILQNYSQIISEAIRTEPKNMALA